MSFRPSLVAPTVGSGEVEGSQNYRFQRQDPPNHPFGKPYFPYFHLPTLQDATIASSGFGHEHFTISHAKQLSFLMPFENDRLYLRELPPFVRFLMEHWLLRYSQNRHRHGGSGG